MSGPTTSQLLPGLSPILHCTPSPSCPASPRTDTGGDHPATDQREAPLDISPCSLPQAALERTVDVSLELSPGELGRMGQSEAAVACAALCQCDEVEMAVPIEHAQAVTGAPSLAMLQGGQPADFPFEYLPAMPAAALHAEARAEGRAEGRAGGQPRRPFPLPGPPPTSLPPPPSATGGRARISEAGCSSRRRRRRRAVTPRRPVAGGGGGGTLYQHTAASAAKAVARTPRSAPVPRTYAPPGAT